MARVSVDVFLRLNLDFAERVNLTKSLPVDEGKVEWNVRNYVKSLFFLELLTRWFSSSTIGSNAKKSKAVDVGSLLGRTKHSGSPNFTKLL